MKLKSNSVLAAVGDRDRARDPELDDTCRSLIDDIAQELDDHAKNALMSQAIANRLVVLAAELRQMRERQEHELLPLGNVRYH